LRQVTHGGYADGGVAWSRDGALLAFTRYSKDTGCVEDQTRGDLYLIGATGKGQRLLSSTGCMFSPPAQPTFALKGQTLAFTDDKGVLLAQAPGWKPRVVLGHGLFPSWAPDARRLVIADGSQIEILDTVTHRTRGSVRATSPPGRTTGS
jgi:Tol biopolymer transport system component